VLLTTSRRPLTAGETESTNLGEGAVRLVAYP
jgi:hypothetical protein